MDILGKIQRHVECTALFVEEHAEAVDRDTNTKSVVVILNAEGFGFLEEHQMEGYWHPMSMASAIKIIRKHMYRIRRRIHRTILLVLEPLDSAPGPFVEQTPCCPNNEPAAVSILCGEEKEVKPANAASCKMVSKVASVIRTEESSH